MNNLIRIYEFQIHPDKDNNNFRSYRNQNRSRPPSGKGNEDCTFDWLLIPGARGNLTNYGLYFFSEFL